MKHSATDVISRKRIFLALFFIFVPTILLAEEKEDTAQEREYNGTVVLVDHKKGLVGVQAEELGSGKEGKFAFLVDFKETLFSTAAGKDLDFSEIQSGDTVDVYTITGKDGIEKVDQIIDYSRFGED